MPRLDELADITGGGTPPRAQPEYFGGGIPWATPTDVTSLDTLYIRSTKETLTQQGLDKSSSKLLPARSVLLTSRATIGYTAISELPICTNQGFVNFTCGPKLRPEYLTYWLRANKSTLERLANGATFKEISRGTVRSLQMDPPSLPRQDEVADLLSRAENIVRMRREAAAKAKEIIPALFLDMFGDPATNPKGWETEPLSRVSEISYGIATKLDSSVTAKTGRRILTISNVMVDGELDLSIERYSQAPDRKAASAKVQTGDLLFNWRNGSETHIGKTAIWEHPESALHVSFLLRIRPASAKATSLYLWALLNRLRSSGFFLSASRQQVNRKFNASELSSLEVPIPPISLQKRFASYAKEIRRHTIAQYLATSIAEQTFQSLLARAFSEVRAT